MAKSITALAIGDKIKLGSMNGRRLVWQVGIKDTGGIDKINAYYDPPQDNYYILYCANNVAQMCMHTTSKHPMNENAWKLSAVRQWLNATENGGGWFSPAYAAQTTPDYYIWDGFLKLFTENETSLMLTDGNGDRVILPWAGPPYYSEDPSQGTATGIPSIFGGSAVDFDADDISGMMRSVQGTPHEQEMLMSVVTTRYLTDIPGVGLGYRTIHGVGSLSNRRTFLDRIYPLSKETGAAFKVRPVCYISTAARVSDSVDADGCYTLVFNNPPPSPGSINIPQQVKGGGENLVSWGRSVDPDGDTVGYKLERQINDGDWEQIYNGSLLTYTDSGIVYGTAGTVKWRVKAYDIYSDESGYTVSASRTIINNRPPVISGADGDMGTFDEIAVSFDYVITDADNDPVDVVVQLDGVTIQSFAATLGATNTVSFAADAWRRILDGAHAIVITATDNTETSTRTKTFTKNIHKARFTSAAFPTEGTNAPLRVSLSAAMQAPENSHIYIFAANNGYDDSPSWEDVTSSVISGIPHTFVNDTKASDDWAIRIYAEMYDFTATLEGINFVPGYGFISNVEDLLYLGDIQVKKANGMVSVTEAGAAAPAEAWDMADVPDGTYDVAVTYATSPVYIASIQGSTNDTTA